MSDRDILERIHALVDEEHHLYERHSAGDEMTEADHERLQSLEVALDQCWDLLRQRRARRVVGADPEAAETRPPDVVERYQQ